MSQIGYMFLGAGLGAYANGMFHLMTHAFFKALLFMAGGIVIHSLTGEQDMRKMGGLRAFAPRTYWAFVIGALALVGVPPFAGFFSKDSILAAAMDHGSYGYVLWVAGLAGSFLTGLYAFRMLFMVFWGEPSSFAREHFHPLERDVVGRSMEWTVAVLAVLSVIGGWLQFAPVWHPVETWLRTVAEPLVSPGGWQEAVSSILAVALGVGGIAVAWLLYGARRLAVPRAPFWQRTLEHKFWFDELYDALFYRPATRIAWYLGHFVEEPLIAGSGREIGEETRDLGGAFARLQSGLLRTYVLAIASAVAVLAIVFVAVK
jgi:NADH-quinone oxidoreductase subunit L